MCGIVGYVGGKPGMDVVLEGLRRLEYRGYDSAGVAVLSDDGVLQVERRAGKLSNLEKVLGDVPLPGSLAIGHTRWAT
ncbi:MAG: glmS, partial [Frankiales bacterium]|nr:glmS [Frankiales bacterium]